MLSAVPAAAQLDPIDPRFDIRDPDDVELVMDVIDQAFYLRIMPKQPWTAGPPLDPYSAYVSVVVEHGETTASWLWEESDGTPMVDVSGAPASQAKSWIVKDGSLLVLLLLTPPPGDDLRISVETGVAANPDDPGQGSTWMRITRLDDARPVDLSTGPLVPVWDLAKNEAMAPPTTTTVTTAPPESTTLTSTTIATSPSLISETEESEGAEEGGGGLSPASLLFAVVLLVAILGLIGWRRSRGAGDSDLEPQPSPEDDTLQGLDELRGIPPESDEEGSDDLPSDALPDSPGDTLTDEPAPTGIDDGPLDVDETAADQDIGSGDELPPPLVSDVQVDPLGPDGTTPATRETPDGSDPAPSSIPDGILEGDAPPDDGDLDGPPAGSSRGTLFGTLSSPGNGIDLLLGTADDDYPLDELSDSAASDTPLRGERLDTLGDLEDAPARDLPSDTLPDSAIPDRDLADVERFVETLPGDDPDAGVRQMIEDAIGYDGPPPDDAEVDYPDDDSTGGDVGSADELQEDLDVRRDAKKLIDEGIDPPSDGS